MRTHPLWREYERPDEESIRAARLEPDDPSRWTKTIRVLDPDPAWRTAAARVVTTVTAALGARALSVEHVGSTAVPGLPAKPVIDVDLVVADPADEAAYVPALEQAGFTLVIREPEWEEHRAFTWREIDSNLHVFGPQAVEPRRHLAFRDWLTTHADDRAAYARAKQAAAAQGFTDVMQYNNAKGALIYDIYEKIFAADPDHAHDPHPR